jgi:large subunit ribosomal protein L7Ae
MPKEKRVTTIKGQKKVAPVPYEAPKKAEAPKTVAPKKNETNPLFESRQRGYGIGVGVQPKRDLTRFVKWPLYVKLQRKRRVLYDRLKTPPAINQFTRTLDKNNATTLFKLLSKYRPEEKLARQKRLLEAAKTRAEAVKAGKPAEKKDNKKHFTVKYGINHITALVESKRAQLVVIAHDVDPIELVIWLPALCRKVGVPYAIVKGKARLGAVVGKKTATALALVGVNKEDEGDFALLTNTIKENFNEKYDEIRLNKATAWGGGQFGAKSIAKRAKKEKSEQKDKRPKTSA